MWAVLSQRRGACCVITRGDQGCWYAAGGELAPAGLRVSVVDTPGCGDVFTAHSPAEWRAAERAFTQAVKIAAASGGAQGDAHGGAPLCRLDGGRFAWLYDSRACLAACFSSVFAARLPAAETPRPLPVTPLIPTSRVTQNCARANAGGHACRFAALLTTLAVTAMPSALEGLTTSNCAPSYGGGRLVNRIADQGKSITALHDLLSQRRPDHPRLHSHSARDGAFPGGSSSCRLGQPGDLRGAGLHHRLRQPPGARRLPGLPPQICAATGFTNSGRTCLRGYAIDV